MLIFPIQVAREGIVSTRTEPRTAQEEVLKPLLAHATWEVVQERAERRVKDYDTLVYYPLVI